MSRSNGGSSSDASDRAVVSISAEILSTRSAATSALVFRSRFFRPGASAGSSGAVSVMSVGSTDGISSGVGSRASTTGASPFRRDRLRGGATSAAAPAPASDTAAAPAPTATPRSPQPMSTRTGFQASVITMSVLSARMSTIHAPTRPNQAAR